MVREFVKWDYELREGQPVDAVVDRALDIAMSEPHGPVYLSPAARGPGQSAPRHAAPHNVRPLGAVAPEPARAVIEQAAALIAKAEFPLIVTSSVGRDPAAVVELGEARGRVRDPGRAEPRRATINLPTDHPMHLGFEPAALARRRPTSSIVLDSVVPWIPRSRRPAQGRQDHPHLGRSAGGALSVPRDRGRPAGHRRPVRGAMLLLRDDLGGCIQGQQRRGR